MAKQVREGSSDPVAEFDESHLKKGAEQIQSLAAALDRRIKATEEWLGNLEGRVQTTVSVQDPEDDSESRLFFLRLASGTWSLNFRYAAKTDRPTIVPPGSWTLVRSGSLNAKMAALAALPLLLEKIGKSQASLIDRLRRATAGFDELANRVGIPAKEGA